MEEKKIKLQDFINMINQGTVMFGDCLCICNGEHGFLNYAISYVQRKLLEDLYGKETISKTDMKYFTQYTHVIRVVDAEKLGENYYPHARTQLWKDYLIGKTVIITRPNYMTKVEGIAMAMLAVQEEKDKVPYPWWKLFQYYGYRWGW